MFSYIKKELLPKLLVSIVVLFAFFLPIVISNIPTFNLFYLILYYGLPVLIYSLLRKSSSVKKQLISDIDMSLILAIPVSLVTGLLVGSVGSDEETIKPFDFTSFMYTFVAFFLSLWIIGFITLCFGFLLRRTILKKLPVVTIK